MAENWIEQCLNESDSPADVNSDTFRESDSLPRERDRKPDDEKENARALKPHSTPLTLQCRYCYFLNNFRVDYVQFGLTAAIGGQAEGRGKSGITPGEKKNDGGTDEVQRGLRGSPGEKYVKPLSPTFTMLGAGKRKTRPPVRFSDYQLDDQYEWPDHASLRDCPSPVVSSLSMPMDELEDEIDHQLAEVSRSIERIQLNEARLREHDQQTKPKKTQRSPPPQTGDIRQDDVPRNSRVRMTSIPRAFSRDADPRTMGGHGGRGAPRKNPSRRPARADEYEHNRGYPSLRDIRSMNYFQDPFTSAERVRAQPRQPPPGDTFGWDLDGDNNRRPRRQRDYSSASQFEFPAGIKPEAIGFSRPMGKAMIVASPVERVNLASVVLAENLTCSCKA
uniref:Uncharacterized protein n=1 Tax=Branchiostoma floridae TaxID=7739 RepID=C3ZY98_BRAFL|eukprot:XP_002586483.1 hypothetical protein BRAFLDRAFT_106624 [Branchiostoma floridae]